MPTTRAYITATEVGRAVAPVKRAVKERKPVPAGMEVIADIHLKGLRLISIGGRISWAMKTSTHTKTLGYAYPENEWPLTAPEKARELGAAVKHLLKVSPEKVDPYLAHRHAGLKHDDALAAIVAKPTTWTLRECFEHTIADKLHPDATERIGELHAAEMMATVNRECVAEIAGKPAVSVTPEDIETVRDLIVKEAVAKGQRGVGPSTKFVTHTRTVLTYCASYHRAASGLNPERPWWQLVKSKFKQPKRDRSPSIEQVVRTFLMAEDYLDKPLPGRAINVAGVGHSTLAGLWWLVLTGQRGDAGLSLRAHDIVEDSERPDWMIAAWDALDMKAGRSFILPVPARAWQHVDRFFQQSRTEASDDWAFPSEDDPDVHVTKSGVYRVLYRLAGRDTVETEADPDAQPKLRKDGKPRRKPERTERRNLLEENDIDWWSPHDCRKTLSKFLTGKKMPGGASAVLAHEVTEKEGLAASATERQRKDFQRQRTAKITAMAYGSEAQFLDLKSEAMTLWTNAVLDEYERQKALSTR